MPELTPQEFVSKWKRVTAREKQTMIQIKGDSQFGIDCHLCSFTSIAKLFLLDILRKHFFKLFL